MSASGSNTPANHFGGSFGPNEWLVDEMFEKYLLCSRGRIKEVVKTSGEVDIYYKAYELFELGLSEEERI